MQGRRVEQGVGHLEQAGDYFPVYMDGGTTIGHPIKWLWFALPNSGHWGRIAAAGGGNGKEPEWTITEDEEGRVTVAPSIDTGPMLVAGVDHAWHGYLTTGVWSHG